MKRAFVGAAALLGACIAAGPDGRPCEASSACGDAHECVFVVDAARRACLPKVAHQETPCAEIADCDAAGFPVEVDCVDDRCECTEGACGIDEILDAARCVCLATDREAGAPCFDDADCDSGLCIDQECVDADGGEGDPCRTNAMCAYPYVCAVDACADEGQEGERCDEDADCDRFAAPNCVNARCRYSAGDPGDSCQDDLECESGSCGTFGCD